MLSYHFCKSRILAHAQKIVPQQDSKAKLGGLIFLLVSGAAMAIALNAPFANVPTSKEISETLPLPIFEYIEQPEATFVREVTVRSGDTLSAVLANLSIRDQELSEYLSRGSGGAGLASSIRTGTTLTAALSQDGRVRSLSIPIARDDKIAVISRTDHGFTLSDKPFALESRLVTASAEIRSSLYAATDEASIPDSVANALADIFGNAIDFNRDLRKGDSLRVVYELQYRNGAPFRAGRILAAEFVNNEMRHTAAWFAPNGADSGAYYSFEGKSLKEGFLRSPVEFSRISSGFSMRMHPILKEWRAHRGTDFAAPAGTRIRAAADGVVAFVGQQNGYGNFVVLQHSGGISTAYGHLRGFAEGLRKGQKVQQGDSIGFVGSTGWATGPHLHYEFRKDGAFLDPLKVALPAAPRLSGPQLAQFLTTSKALVARLDLPKQAKIARSE